MDNFENRENLMTYDFKSKIYELMNGNINLEICPVKESEYVKDEFEEGSFCAGAYNEVYNARERLCRKLGTEEDEDIEIIINSLLDIAKHLSLKMYDYGAYFSSSPNK